MMLPPPAQELADLRLGTDAYAEQVSRDFEELTWLRCLSEQLEACDASSPLGHVAAGILSELRSIIGAEAVVLVGSDQGATPLEPGRCCDCRIVFAAGRPLVDDVACRALIEALATESGNGPLIRNRIEPGCLPADCNDIHSYMAVPVTRQELQYGWLLAFNRKRPTARPIAGEGRRAPLPGEDEFGTEEAGLFHAAA